jgi:tRNA(adenine34) deaminase
MPIIERDRTTMELALGEADQAARRGDLPVGAVLTVGGEVVGSAGNRARSGRDATAHAELTLLRSHQERLSRSEGRLIEVHTTLEPCLMCLGAMLTWGVNRVVYGCPDPVGGATALAPGILPPWYEHRWPAIEGGLLREASYDLLVAYLKTDPDTWAGILERFEAMRSLW